MQTHGGADGANGGWARRVVAAWRGGHGSVVALCGLLLVAGACRRDGPDVEATAATMAELRRVNETLGLDSAARMRARSAVLQRRGLTPAEFEREVAALASDPQVASVFWQRADSLLREQTPSTTGAAGSAAAPPPPAPPIATPVP